MMPTFPVFVSRRFAWCALSPPAVRLGVLMLADRVTVYMRSALLDREVMKCGAAATFGWAGMASDASRVGARTRLTAFSQQTASLSLRMPFRHSVVGVSSTAANR